jgi:hypothetical protein
MHTGEEKKVMKVTLLMFAHTSIGWLIVADSSHWVNGMGWGPLPAVF